MLKYSGCRFVPVLKRGIEEDKGVELEGNSAREGQKMHYNVTYHVGTEEFTDEVDAPDAATAVSKIQFEHGRGDDHFELISVQLLDSLESEPEQVEEPDSALK
jgi:hypothetical protein